MQRFCGLMKAAEFRNAGKSLQTVSINVHGGRLPSY
jgi:hypothetical protein